MSEAYIVAGVRTPIGRYGGALASVRPDDLAAHAIREALARLPGIPTDQIDEVVLGCANQAGEDNRNVGRMAALLAGLPETVPGTTINRLCGSGLDAVGYAARAIKLGEADIIIAGGVESMSRAPFVMPKASSAFQRSTEIFDTTIGWRFVNPLMEKQYGIDSMPETAENVAAEFAISRDDQDHFALRSQARAAAAQKSGRFAREIAPVTIRGRKGEATVIEHDEHPRETTIEKLAGLSTPFRADGTVTAGNASGVNDGAAAVIIVSARAVERYGLKPLAKVDGMATAGVAPRIMGIGPVASTRKLLERTGLSISDIDIVELNEAFAAQSLACMRQFGLADDAAHVNPNGGAIALGHPLGMSGARLALTAALELDQQGARRALASMCIGVGQGISLLMSRP
ncbi:3-oxoadipyl-CoA thiolase [Aminobacter anthyllidis]|jgi:3-oxoadipyl-CoA thiolase|uniref:3-oxoadipyl-CoA thiolase n=1 Tax=Aminobacter anthyllidis TaxID=1035067 RepID=UPI002457A1DC|nr:3-oxoadipyl-CoA thiolase [Aminobacter anthyllidis]MDH4984246.1 3-oxoadipyl-CoA thiolase [Aminobacter anthyllidis]